MPGQPPGRAGVWAAPACVHTPPYLQTRGGMKVAAKSLGVNRGSACGLLVGKRRSLEGVRGPRVGGSGPGHMSMKYEAWALLHLGHRWGGGASRYKEDLSHCPRSTCTYECPWHHCQGTGPAGADDEKHPTCTELCASAFLPRNACKSGAAVNPVYR